MREHDAALGGPAATLRYASADGEEGFPGRVDARVTYALGGDGTWRVDYEATTDRATVVNLSHHDYFNLAGHGSAMAHVLTLPASRYNPVDDALIPTGIADVAGTPFDFRTPTPIGARLGDGHPQLAKGGGYDHNWILDDARSARCGSRRGWPTPRRAARWNCTPPSRRCSSTRATSWTASSWAATARPTSAATPSAWSRSTAPIRRTTPTGRRRCCGPARRTAALSVYPFTAGTA